MIVMCGRTSAYINYFSSFKGNIELPFEGKTIMTGLIVSKLWNKASK